MRINYCMCYVYGMRESTGKYTEVRQRLGSESLRDIAGSVNLPLANFGSFSPRKSERRFAAIYSAGHGLGKLLNAITSSTVYKTG